MALQSILPFDIPRDSNWLSSSSCGDDDPTVPSVPAAQITYARHPRAKRYVIRVVAHGDDTQVRVTIPRWGSKREAARFVDAQRAWIDRRLSAGLRDADLPDLLVIDGGRGQLSVARAVCEEKGVSDLEVVGLAKSRPLRDLRAREVQHSGERVFIPGRVNPVVLPRNSNALFLLQRVRDEAHRFAIEYHRKLRDRARLKSPLEDVPGIGAARKRGLLRRFGSLAALREASIEQLAAVPGIGRALATAIQEHLAACRP